MAIEAFAPAKINLTLHVTGQRSDGYHLLDSLVVFADIGDTVQASASDRLTLAIDGPEGAELSNEPDNLVLRAARLLDPERGTEIILTKTLPVASGIGGGSSDAAAALRALSVLWACPLPQTTDLLALGADVPVCLDPRPWRMSGIGETLHPVPPLPALDILLVNPRRAVSTPEVFRALGSKANPPMPRRLPDWRDAAAFCSWLKTQRNDLAAPAIGLCPEIGEVLTALDGSGTLHAGMSGSGATCFALFPTDGSARRASAALRADHPQWWIADGRLL